jgi:hypothetical protein
MGQVWLEAIHASMQGRWKACRHGSRRSSSPPSYSPRQMVQVCFDKAHRLHACTSTALQVSARRLHGWSLLSPRGLMPQGSQQPSGLCRRSLRCAGAAVCCASYYGTMPVSQSVSQSVSQ